MDIEIRRLTPALAEAYVHFFDVTPHFDNKDDEKCYCVTWRNDDTYEGDGHWYPTRQERRARALAFVQSGSLQGYLACSDGKAVGWCNATGDCQGGVDYLRAFWPIPAFDPNVRVKSIFCFVIAPQMRKKGIASQLVQRVCDDAAAEGYDFVEAYVEAKAFDADHDFRGSPSLFAKCGFTQSALQDQKIVMRKNLKGR